MKLQEESVSSGVIGLTESAQTQRLDQIIHEVNLKEAMHFLK
jgi:hypothetical protein